jgi:hypothetical protein
MHEWIDGVFGTSCILGVALVRPVFFIPPPITFPKWSLVASIFRRDLIASPRSIG